MGTTYVLGAVWKAARAKREQSLQRFVCIRVYVGLVGSLLQVGVQERYTYTASLEGFLVLHAKMSGSDRSV